MFLVLHCLILLYQVITLNVSVNSYSNSVLSLLVSNQFMELKSSVFKKFERETLFQLCFSDSIERFQLFLFIFIIGIRNLSQIGFTSNSEILNRIVYPLALIYCTEFFIDGLKHSFITKFNHINSNFYNQFKISISNDFSLIPSNIPDKSLIISRKMGFSSIPHTCLIITILFDLLKGKELNIFTLILCFILILIFKFSLNISLLKNNSTDTINKGQ